MRQWLVLLVLLLPVAVQAAAFKVYPLSLSLDGQKKSTVLKIQNTSERAVTVQLESKAWTQDDSGEDVYRPTSDIIFFPKIATIKRGEERLVRIGFRGQMVKKTPRYYRMFVQELPVNNTGGALNFLLRFSIPLFVESRPQQKQFVIKGGEVSQHQARVKIANPGGGHLIVQRLIANMEKHGKPLGSHEQGGWYVLPGAAREFRVDLQEQCQQADQVELMVQVGQSVRNLLLPVQQQDCLN